MILATQNINIKILSAIDDYQFLNYGCEPNEIKNFMSFPRPFLNRQRKAIDIINGILTRHGKERLLSHVAELARIEHGIRELEPWVRDHVVHALLSFILGIYLEEKFISQSYGVEIDRFQWKLAGLLHDVAYPAQIARDILRPFSEKINEIKRELEVSAPDVFFKIVPVNIEKLRNNQNSLDLIQNQINKWDLKINAESEYRTMVSSGKICHGMISGLAILYVIDLMYQKYNPKREWKDIILRGSGINWNQKYFENDVIPACAAIFIHNLDRQCFSESKISPYKAPLAFLLKLSDLLQEWERPSQENREGFSAERFDIDIVDDSIIFKADIPERRKRKIEEEISETLDCVDIRIE